MPCFVYKVRVCTYGIYFDTHFLKFAVLVSHIDQFGRTNKSEVGRIEENHGPFAFQVCVCDFFEFEALEGLNAERLKLGAY